MTRMEAIKFLREHRPEKMAGLMPSLVDRGRSWGAVVRGMEQALIREVMLYPGKDRILSEAECIHIHDAVNNQRDPLHDKAAAAALRLYYLPAESGQPPTHNVTPPEMMQNALSFEELKQAILKSQPKAKKPEPEPGPPAPEEKFVPPFKPFARKLI